MQGQEVYLRKFYFFLSSEFCSRVWSRDSRDRCCWSLSCPAHVFSLTPPSPWNTGRHHSLFLLKMVVEKQRARGVKGRLIRVPLRYQL